MIGIITEDGKLRITAEIPIPNAESGQWTPQRIKALARDIEAHVSANELADLSERTTRNVNPWPPRKPNFRSGLVVDDHGAIR